MRAYNLNPNHYLNPNHRREVIPIGIRIKIRIRIKIVDFALYRLQFIGEILEQIGGGEEMGFGSL